MSRRKKFLFRIRPFPFFLFRLEQSADNWTYSFSPVQRLSKSSNNIKRSLEGPIFRPIGPWAISFVATDTKIWVSVFVFLAI